MCSGIVQLPSFWGCSAATTLVVVHTQPLFVAVSAVVQLTKFIVVLSAVFCSACSNTSVPNVIKKVYSQVPAMRWAHLLDGSVPS